MKRFLLILALVLVFAISAGSAVTTMVAVFAPGLGSSDFLLGGIQVNEPDHDRWVDGLRRAGMNTVSVTVYAHQGNWNTDHLWFDEEAPSVVSEIRAARRRGLKAVLILRVALDHAFEENRFLWHGMIMPHTDEQVESWFRQYSQFVLNWARIAEQEGVEVLGIASEMNALTSTRSLEEIPALETFYLDREQQERYKQTVLEDGALADQQALWGGGAEAYDTLGDYLEAREAKHRRWAEQVSFVGEGDRLARINGRRQLLERLWRQLIEQVRPLYRGRLTYAANFDQYQEVGFWPQLDVMGINAYFPIRSGEVPAEELEASLTAGWAGVLEEIAAFRRRQAVAEMPVVFTELGYTFRKDSTIHPWASTGFSVVWKESEAAGAAAGEGEERLVVWGDRPQNFGERALAIRGLHRAVEQTGDDLLHGILYWKLSTIPSHREVEPFVLILGDDPLDPMLTELQRFSG